MNLNQYDTLNKSIVYPQNKLQVEEWFQFYRKFDPEIGNLPDEELDILDSLSNNLKMLLIRKCRREDVLREALHGEML